VKNFMIPLAALTLFLAPHQGWAAGPKVAVTITPLAEIIKRRGGPGTEVFVIIKPGQSPHGYEPTPGQVTKIASADFLVMAGLGLDNWILKIAKAAGKNGAGDIVDCSRSLDHKDLISPGEHGAEKEHDGHGDEIANPHWWLDPTLMARAARTISHRMAEGATEAQKSGFQQRLEALENDLAALDSKVKDELKEARGGFVAFHGAWDYFARRYELNQVGVLEESPGKSSSARKFAQLAGRITKEGGGAVMAEPQFSGKLAQALADEAGVKLGIADPMGGAPGREGYFEMMLYNAHAFKEALGAGQSGR